MELTLHLENVSSGDTLPDDEDVHRWLFAALNTAIPQVQQPQQQAEVCLRIVDEAESAEFNQRYRGKTGATNVLSFPAQLNVDHPLLGDLVVCAPVVERESREQGKSFSAHWAHILVHGSLHLLGFDHIDDQDAVIMENLEVNILKQLGFPDPYHL